MSKVDTTDPIEVEKVGRYLRNIEMYRRMERTVKEEGVSVTVENGNQSYIKSHPLLAEMNKVNAAIINIEKTFNFIGGDDGDKPNHTAEDLI
nr:P27 family phage terminase small subunit [Alkalibacillus almallahensis]